MKSCIVLLLVSPFTYSIYAADEIAVTLFVSGKVSYTQNGKKLDLKKNVVLGKEDTIESADGKADIQVGPNAVIRLAPFSKVKIADLSSSAKENKSTVQLVSGKVFARVDKSDKKENFSVSSTSYTAGVRGTQFVVSEESEEARKQNPKNEDSNIPNGIFVKEGEVGVTTSSGNSVPVKSGEEAILSPEGLLKQPLEIFMQEKMKILDGFRKISEENYQLLKNQREQNQEMIRKARESSYQ
ncbi:FecR family protein [Leptospira perolatii]|nr:FecR family protein [Leptospira perolatii]